MPDDADLLGLPSVQRLFAASVEKEREALEAFLDFLREAVSRKLDGLSDEDARRRLVGSATTLAGLVRHLRIVEMNWFQRLLAGTPEAELPIAVDWTDPDGSFGPDGTTAALVEEYRHQCAVSREIAARHALDDTFDHPELGTTSLRWVYVHMIEETARHAGHADILRELTDGRTGL